MIGNPCCRKTLGVEPLGEASEQGRPEERGAGRIVRRVIPREAAGGGVVDVLVLRASVGVLLEYRASDSFVRRDGYDHVDGCLYNGAVRATRQTSSPRMAAGPAFRRG